jgi:hypothetical protein
MSRSGIVLSAAGLALSLGVVSSASAQAWPLSTIVTRKLADGSAATVPGLPADQLQAATDAGTTISWAAPAFGTQGLSTPPSIDNNGNVAFFGFMANLSVNAGFPPVSTTVISASNARAAFYAPLSGPISIMARDGSSATASPGQGGPTPAGLPSGWTMNNSSNGNGLNNTGIGMSSSGVVMFAATVNGSGATTSNNTAFFSGGPSSISTAARNGTLAPDYGAVTGASFNQNMVFSAQGGITGALAVNPSGQVAFTSGLTGGSGLNSSGTNQNNSGLFVGSGASGSSVVTNVARMGDAVPGTAGAVFGAFPTLNSQFNQAINASGGVAFVNFNSTSNGTVPATAAQSAGLYYAPAGQSPQAVAQAGTAVGAALPGENYVNGTASARSHLSLTSGMLNNNGMIGFVGKFAPSANVTAGVNDTAVMTWQGGTTNIIARTGVTPVPSITTNTFSDVDFFDGSNGNLRLNNNGSLFFRGTVSAGNGVVAGTNDKGIWKFDAATAAGQLIVQSGTVAPGSGGATFTGTPAINAWNNRDEIVFTSSLSDGRTALYAYSPFLSVLTPIIFTGDTSIMGANFPVSGTSFSISGASNGNGGSQSLTDTGWLTFGVNGNGALGTNYAIVRVQIPAPGAGALAGLGMLMAARRKRR